MKHIAKDALSDLYITVTPEVKALTVLAEVDVTGYCESDYARWKSRFLESHSSNAEIKRLLMELAEKGTSLVHITIIPQDPKITCEE